MSTRDQSLQKNIPKFQGTCLLTEEPFLEHRIHERMSLKSLPSSVSCNIGTINPVGTSIVDDREESETNGEDRDNLTSLQ